MKPRILGINGIRTDGSSSTDKLLIKLTELGYPTVDVNYPRVNIFTARSRKRQHRNARILKNISKPGDVLVAHSYGCLLALRAMEQGARFKHVFFFAPAMNVDFTFPYHGMGKLSVIYNPTDNAIRAGMLLWNHDFGAMGREGYQGPPDNRIDSLKDLTSREGEHSDFFNDKNIGNWTEYIDLLIGGQHEIIDFSDSIINSY